MQIAVITGPTKEIAKSRILLANKRMDGIELRLDLFRHLDPSEVEELIQASTGKTIVTLRSRRNGGSFLGTEAKRLAILQQILGYFPSYVDLDYDTDPASFAAFSETFPNTHIISSYHNFDRTPRHIEIVFNKMICPYAYAYKICSTANSLSDSFKMLRFIQEMTRKRIRVIGLCMGKDGEITRREGINAGNYLNYSILHRSDSCAPGLQLA